MSLKSSLYRNQCSRLPPPPKKRTEIRVEGVWMKTLTGENFLLHDDCDCNTRLIFGMQENLLKLSELNTMYVGRPHTYIENIPKPKQYPRWV